MTHPTSRGPATVHDHAKGSGLTVTQARRGMEVAGDELAREIIGDRNLWFASSTAESEAGGAVPSSEMR